MKRINITNYGINKKAVRTASKFKRVYSTSQVISELLKDPIINNDGDKGTHNPSGDKGTPNNDMTIENKELLEEFRNSYTAPSTVASRLSLYIYKDRNTELDTILSLITDGITTNPLLQNTSENVYIDFHFISDRNSRDSLKPIITDEQTISKLKEYYKQLYTAKITLDSLISKPGKGTPNRPDVAVLTKLNQAMLIHYQNVKFTLDHKLSLVAVSNRYQDVDKLISFITYLKNSGIIKANITLNPREYNHYYSFTLTSKGFPEKDCLYINRSRDAHIHHIEQLKAIKANKKTPPIIP